MNYYPFHLGDYFTHTGHLEPMEDLAYRRMLDAYYLREAPLPLDPSEVARLVRMRQNIADVEAVLSEFFEPVDNGWRHTRCDQEIERMRDKQAKARASATASVNARRAKAQQPESECLTNVERSLNERLTGVELPTPTPTPTPTPEEREAPRKRDTPTPADKSKTLTAYLESCKANKTKPVPDGHSLRAWAAEAGITGDMLQIAWVQFRERYTEAEKGKGKRYKDWPGHFATAVKNNWFKLWFAGDHGMQWSSNGLTHKTVLDARMKKEADHA